MRKLKQTSDSALCDALLQLRKKGIISGVPEDELRNTACFEVNSDRSRGDMSSTCCLQLAKKEGMNPRQLGETVAAVIADTLSDIASEVRVDGPGFINLFLERSAYIGLLHDIFNTGTGCERPKKNTGTKINLEFVSANPTGPLSVAHGRQAAVGDTMARILSCAGHEVTREYFLNDTGNQIRLLGLSIYARLMQEEGRPFEFPEEGYKGEYISEIAHQAPGVLGKDITDLPQDEAVKRLADYGMKLILDGIRQDLLDFGVNFDEWTSQAGLEASGLVEGIMERLTSENKTYEKDGAIWFKGTDYGDFQDKVLVKEDGSYTYRTPDIAYHDQKFQRGFNRIIDLWGPDHHGHIPCIQSAMKAVERDPESMDLQIVQQCTLWKGKKKVKMSTRAGTFVTLREIMEEVGRDAARYFFLMRKADSHMDFDLELAKQRSMENPVYYAQYAHARVVGISEHAMKDERFCADDFDNGLYSGVPGDTELLMEEDVKLIPAMARFPIEIDGAARNLDPQRITNYAHDLSTVFQRYYTYGKKDPSYRIVTENTELTRARLYLVAAFGTTLRAVLDVLGVSAPDRM